MTRLRPLFRALFGSPLNAAISVLILLLLGWAVPPLWNWAIVGATWEAANRRGCAVDGACWAFIRARLGLLFYGPYPVDQRWRIDLAGLLLLVVVLGALFARRRRGVWLVLLLGAVPVATGVLLAGGVPGLPPVPTVYWGGLTLNVVLSFVVISAAIPIGTLLAFGRRSRWPFVHGLCTAAIEFWRGVPLLAVLFMGLVLLPMALPAGFSLDNLFRAVVVLTLFESAYMAEVVRGGLQGVDHGQREAASALGLHAVQANLAVVLPQALRIALPGIVNLAVDLFKDTTLVSIVGVFDLMGVVNQSLKDQAWIGFAREGYLFAAVVFFLCCLLISIAGSAMEKRLAKQEPI